MTVCALCKKEAPLRNSHILPAFVYRWMRQTSATGHIRSATNPRVRAQDGLKIPLLCAACEQRFSRFETQFATQIFYPIQRDKVSEVQYIGWFLKFCVSISWRILAFATQQDLTNLNQSQKEESGKALARWGQYLLDEVAHPGQFEQRLVLLSAIRDVPQGLEMPTNINRYFMRSIDMDVVNSDSITFTYAKLGRFAFFGIVKIHERWEGTKINANAGTVGPKHYQLPAALFHYWNARATRHSEAYRKIPAVQQDNLVTKVLQDPKRSLKSGTFEAMERDVSLFGQDAFWEHKER